VKISLLQAVEAPRVARSRGSHIIRQTANRWRQGCQPYAPAALYPQVSFLRFLVNMSVRGWVDPRAIVRLEGLGQLKKFRDHIGTRYRDLLACRIVPQPTTLPRAPIAINYVLIWNIGPEVPTAVITKRAMFCIVAPCSSETAQCFGGTYRPHFQGRIVRRAINTQKNRQADLVSKRRAVSELYGITTNKTVLFHTVTCMSDYRRVGIGDSIYWPHIHSRLMTILQMTDTHTN
jgi:hypothetical protein